MLAVLLGVVALGCVRRTYRSFDFGETKVPAEIQRLVRQRPDYFQHVATLLMLVDTTPCGGALAESKFWNDWQKATFEAGIGFVVATSKADSGDVAIALALQHLDAPVLVLPSCPDTVLGLGIPRGYLPLKLLVERSGRIRYWCACVIDTAWNNRFLHDIDSTSSVVASEQ